MQKFSLPWMLPLLLIILFHQQHISSNLLAQEKSARPEFIDDKTEKLTNAALQWLASRQNMDGSFGTELEYSQKVGVTALAGIAFLASGSVPEAGPYSAHVARCTEFLLSCSQANGYLVNSTEETHGPMYGHGFGTMFLAEVYGMTPQPELREKLKRAVNLIILTQNDQGGWRYNPVPDEADISVTVCQVMALRAARNAGIGVPKEVIDAAVEYIKTCQNPDGGFRYRIFDAAESKFARSAAAIVALYTAGVTQDEAITRGFDYLQRQRQFKQETEYYFYAEYYATQAHWHFGGDNWTETFPLIRDGLASRANENHWKNRVTGDEYATAMALIALQIPKNLVPIFDR